MSLFLPKRPDTPIRAQLETRYRSARFSLLLIIAFTAINMIMCVGQTGMFWLFSANIPYLLTDLGMYFGGMYRVAEGAVLPGFGALGRPFFFAMLAVAILFLCVYFVCWLLSEKKSAWLFATLIIFSVDTVVMIVMPLLGMADVSVDFAFDVALHACAIYELIDGLLSWKRLAALNAEEDTAEPVRE